MAARSDRVDREAVAVLERSEAAGALVAAGRAVSHWPLAPLTDHTAPPHFQEAAGRPWQPNTTILRSNRL